MQSGLVAVSVDEPKTEPVGQVLVLPGARYSITEPGLFWPCTALINLGWRAVVVRWEWTEAAADDPERFLEAVVNQAETHFDPGLETIVMAKSIGSLAARWAADKQMRGIWLTPLLQREDVVSALIGCPPKSLLVGGTADPTWALTPELRSRHLVVEVPEMDHAFRVGMDWKQSLAALGTVCETVQDFVASDFSAG